MVAVEVRIPAQFVATGWGTPTVCTRHGEPAVERKRVNFVSRTPGWAYVLLLVGVIVFIIVASAIRKTVATAAWPFCAKCNAERKRGLTIGLSILAAAVVAFVLAAVLPDSSSGLAILLGVVLLVVGYVVAIRGGSRAMRANGHVTDGGQWVQFDRAHEAFAAQAFAAQQAAAQQAAAQYPAQPQIS